MTDTPRGPGELASLLERARSNDPDDALTNESPLSLEVSGKYVCVLFTTGGPHLEILAEYSDSEAAEYWFESRPRVGILTFMDWGTREDVTVSADDTADIMSAIMRDPDELEPDDDDDTDDDDDDAPASVTVDGVTLEVRRAGFPDPHGEARTVYAWTITRGDRLEAAGHDLYTGVGFDRGPVDMLSTFLAFLEACGESVAYGGGENSDLFPPAVAAWASDHRDEIGMARLELEENDDNE